MKKILIAVLIVLLIVLGYFTIVQGIHIGKFEVLGVKGLKKANENLDTQITKASNLTSTDFPKVVKDLNTNAKNLMKVKEDYTDLTKYTTSAEVDQATELPNYEIEFLWGRIGTWARKEGVKLDMVVNTATTPTSPDGRKLFDLNLTAKGSYIGIALFISDLENDSDLEFKIQNFKMIQATDGLQGTFTVANVPIKLTNLTQPVQTDNTNNTINNTTTTNTTNTTAGS